MTYEEWIECVKKCINAYDEGAINADEVFNAVIGKAVELQEYNILNPTQSEQNKE